MNGGASIPAGSPEAGRAAGPGGLTLILPVYQDGPRVIPVVATLFETVQRPLRIIAVYDREDDPTRPCLEALRTRYPGLSVVRNDQAYGCLPAILTGMKRVETEYVGLWVSYLVDPHGALNHMLEKMDAGCDLVSANRYSLQTTGLLGGGIKRPLSVAGNMFVQWWLGLPIRDLSTAIKIFRTDVLRKLTVETDGPFGWAVLVEWVLKFARDGRRMEEVEFAPRNLCLLHRESNFRLLPQLKSYARWMAFAAEHRRVIRAHYRREPAG